MWNDTVGQGVQTYRVDVWRLMGRLYAALTVSAASVFRPYWSTGQKWTYDNVSDKKKSL